MANFIRITSFIHIADLHEAVRFFVEVLGFEVWIHADVDGLYADLKP